jgi:hypothetical protein
VKKRKKRVGNRSCVERNVPDGVSYFPYKWKSKNGEVCGSLGKSRKDSVRVYEIANQESIIE